MPPVRSARNRKPPPDGFEDIEDILLEFSNKMKDAENASHEGKKKHEVLWPIFQISHQRSRYIYELYYDKEAISKQLYDWLLKNGYADSNLIAKWKKQGYEKRERLGVWFLQKLKRSSSETLALVRRQQMVVRKKEGITFLKGQRCFQKPASELSSSSKMVELKRLLLDCVSRSRSFANSSLTEASIIGDLER
ncbi:MAG: hypothetical protein Q9225_000279 [Loekoesia sp. 1 TL-2023]